MNQKLNILYETSTMPEYVVDQLTAGLLPSFLPVSFVYDQNNCTGVYATGNYRPLSSIQQIEIKDLLWIICRLLEMIAENEKHYFFGEIYKVSRNTVYVNHMYTQVRLVFEPMDTLCPIKIQLYNLLQDCKSMVSQDGLGYLEDMAAWLTKEDVGYISAIHHGEQLQNEIYACDIQ